MARYVIGDIHGCSKALRSLLQALQLTSNDEVVFLGDYIDRGPNSREVVSQVIQLQQCCQVIALRGNHEVMLQGVVLGGRDDETWLRSGGNTTVTSYGGSVSKIPSDHLDFFQSLHRHHETEKEIFVHAMYHPQTPVASQSDELTYWTHLPTPLPLPHESGKRVFLGHTPQPHGDVLLLEHLGVIDTYCFGGGYLTAFDLDRCKVVQADRHGHVRRVPIEHLLVAAKRCLKWLRKS